MKKLLVIDNEVVEVTNINNYDNNSYYIECDNGCEYYIFDNRETAGQIARERWQDMKDNDKAEFRCMIGDERLIQWACGESDSFGISSFDEFLDVIETVPEEEFAGYDHCEIEIDRINKGLSYINKNLKEELGFGSYDSVVLYRNN